MRSRYYTPTVGRFLTRDTWDGNIEQPMSLNKWLYVEGNPINRTDPSGKCYVQITGTSVVWFPDSSPLCQLQAQAQSMARAYNRNKAVETALAWFRKDPYYSNNCANFVSAVLAEAGIYDSLGNWKPGSSWWIRSGDGNREDLFHFLTKYFRFAEYNQGDYGRFRPRLDEGFQSWLRGLQGRLRKGDVVFYKEVGIDPQKTIPAVWTHAAIVVDPYAPETSMYMKVTGPGLLKPRIVEHSGALNIYCRHNGQSPYCRSESSLDTGRSSETLDAGRSIDDTKRQMHAIAIVFMGEPLGVLP